MRQLFLTSSCYIVLDRLIKNLNRSPKEMKVAFIPTAAEVEKGDLQWLKKDRDSLIHTGFQVEDFTFTNQSSDQVKTALSEVDVIFMSGGNTFYLLQQIQKAEAGSIISELVNNGKIYIGSSAGSVVAGSSIELVRYLDDEKDAPDLKGYEGLNLTDVSILPHWGSEHFMDRYMKTVKSFYQNNSKVILLTDQQYVHVIDENYKIN